MKAELGMFDTASIDHKLEYSWYREQVLMGREALGEPEDFEY